MSGARIQMNSCMRPPCALIHALMPGEKALHSAAVAYGKCARWKPKLASAVTQMWQLRQRLEA